MAGPRGTKRPSKQQKANGKANGQNKRRKTAKDEPKKLKGPPSHIPLAEVEEDEDEERNVDEQEMLLDENELDLANAAQFAAGLDVKQITKFVTCRSVSGVPYSGYLSLQIAQGSQEGTS